MHLVDRAIVPTIKTIVRCVIYQDKLLLVIPRTAIG